MSTTVIDGPAPASRRARSSRAPRTRRKVIALTVAALGVAGLGLASAAQLTLNAGALGAGTTVVASCDDSVDVAYTNTFAATASGYTVSAVVLKNVAAACEGQTVKVNLLDGAPASTSSHSLTELTGQVATGSTTVTLAVPAGTTVKATDVKGAAVVIAN